MQQSANVVWVNPETAGNRWQQANAVLDMRGEKRGLAMRLQRGILQLFIVCAGGSQVKPHQERESRADVSSSTYERMDHYSIITTESTTQTTIGSKRS